MKRLYVSMFVLLTVLVLAACGGNMDTPKNNGADEPNASENNEPVNADTNTGDLPNEAVTDEDMGVLMESLPFKKIDVEIKYKDDVEFEIEMKQKGSAVSAEVEDEVHGVDIDNDMEAFNYIYPKVKNLSVAQDTAKEDVISMILEAFDLPDDYEKFEAELTFSDGTEIEFKDVK